MTGTEYAAWRSLTLDMGPIFTSESRCQVDKKVPTQLVYSTEQTTTKQVFELRNSLVLISRRLKIYVGTIGQPGCYLYLTCSSSLVCSSTVTERQSELT